MQLIFFCATEKNWLFSYQFRLVYNYSYSHFPKKCTNIQVLRNVIDGHKKYLCPNWPDFLVRKTLCNENIMIDILKIMVISTKKIVFGLLLWINIIILQIKTSLFLNQNYFSIIISDLRLLLRKIWWSKKTKIDFYLDDLGGVRPKKH